MEDIRSVSVCHGKIRPIADGGVRIELGEIETARMNMSIPYVAPETAEEILVSGIWQNVLRVSNIGMNDPFLMLGGDSVSADTIAARLSNALSIDLPDNIVFEHPTIGGLCRALQADALPVTGLPKVKKSIARETYPLAYPQEQFLFKEKLNPGTLEFNQTAVLRLGGSIQPKFIEEALNRIVKRHCILRTVFREQDGVPYQSIMKNMPLRVHVNDVDGDVQKAERLAEKDLRTPFDLARGPLLRAGLVKITKDDWRLYLAYHHIVLDGVSVFNILFRELQEIYQALTEKRDPVLQETALGYHDFAVWQREVLQPTHLAPQAAYWRGKLKNAQQCKLSTDHTRTAKTSRRGNRIRLGFPAQLSTDLKRYCHKQHVTLFSALIAAYRILLHTRSGQKDLAVATVADVRNSMNLENVCGLLLAPLIIRGEMDPTTTLNETIQQTHALFHEAFSNKNIPFQQMISLAQRNSHDGSSNPLSEAFFVLEPGIPESPLGWEIGRLDIFSATCKSDLAFILEDRPAGLMGGVEYAVDLFDAHTINDLIKAYQCILEQIVVDSSTAIKDLVLSGFAKNENLSICHGKVRPIPDKCIHQLFEEQVDNNPDAIALVFGDQTMTYKELDRRANRLAHYLIAQGIQVEDRVGICLESSFNRIIAVLGVLKAGGAYLPIDPEYPEERIRFIMQDSQLVLLISSSDFKLLGIAGTKCLLVDKSLTAIENYPDDSPQVKATSVNLAYVIYTSGSTGKPKGTLIEHRSLCNVLIEKALILQLSTNSRQLHFLSISFDAASEEILLALTSGAALVLALSRDMDGILQFIKRQEVTHAFFTPSMLLHLSHETELPALKCLTVGGEKCTAALVKRWGRNRRLLNGYGPTEATICISAHECDPDGHNDPPLGKPIANIQTYVLDEWGRIVDIGRVGELHIGGDCLARGYLNRPELTAQRFIPNPFARGRLYKTGDLVRMLSDGNLEFIGRVDHQVKIRGFRIELGEIETALHEIPAIKDCLVIVREDTEGDKRLVAYYTTEKGLAPDVSDLRMTLEQSLPHYMIPAHFVHLDALALTPNGKVDLKALPKPGKTPVDIPIQAAKTDMERSVMKCWCEVLDAEQVGIDQSFFDLGGDSFLILRLQSLLKQKIGKQIPVAQLFQHPTVQTQAHLFFSEKKAFISDSFGRRMDRLRRKR